MVIAWIAYGVLLWLICLAIAGSFVRDNHCSRRRSVFVLALAPAAVGVGALVIVLSLIWLPLAEGLAAAWESVRHG